MSRPLILAAMILAACKSEMRTTGLPVTETPSATSGSSSASASATASPSASASASAPTLTSFPPLDDACVTTADCDSTSFTHDCCMRCETSVGSKAWVAKVAAYCDGVAKSGGTVHCPPTLCANGAAPQTAALGYLNALPRCVGGHCVKPH